MHSEVAIVGAGLAGLAAARALADRGVDVALYEATDRIGGRAHTIRDGTGAPVELGPEFIHGRVDATLALAREAHVALDDIADRHLIRRRGQLDRVDDIWDRFGRLVAAARHQPDESARAYLERSRMQPDDAKLFAMLVEGFYAAPLDDISIAGIVADHTGGNEGDGQWRVRGGYDQLATFLLSRLSRVAIHRNFVVTDVEWGPGGGIRLNGTATARRAIVTLPVGVMKAGAVAFWPGVGDHATALSGFAMGQVVKVVLCMREPVWPEDLAFLHGEAGFPTFWTNGLQLTAWAGGPHAMALAKLPQDLLVQRAVEDFAALLGRSPAFVGAAVVDYHHHDYANDPFARGAYSYTRVGGTRAAKQLARPLADTLFWAGEATDPELEGTVAGALASGKRAASQVLASIG